MYYPYFRGKTYELICIRENADLMASAKFVPIIEPVRESLGGLRRALDAVEEAGGQAVLVMNPRYGDWSDDSSEIRELAMERAKSSSVLPGILLDERTTVDDAIQLGGLSNGTSVAIVHAGYSDARRLADELRPLSSQITHVFLEDQCSRLYRRQFDGANRILLRDGFKRRKNKDYPSVESFSDLHVTYEEDKMDGFGDFLVVGDEYSETGGPAYAVAIHLTFIDPDRLNEMLIYHFKSDSISSPKNPGGKFKEALKKLVGCFADGGSNICETEAMKVFITLHEKEHFPGLGTVKKLSMNHHIETLAMFLGAGS
jgi:hypothetical protein